MKRILFGVLVAVLATAAAADDTDLLHVKLDMDVNPTTQVVTATAIHSVQAAQDDVKEYGLRLHRSFVVSAVKVNGNPASSTRPTDEIKVALDRTYKKGEPFTVEVSYAGVPASQFFGSFKFSVHGTSRMPVIWSLSEPWYAYTWWAAKETLTDKFQLEMWLTVPDPLIAASNGLLQGVDPLPEGKKRYRWKTVYPLCTYAVCLNISDYQVRTDRYRHLGADMPVEFYGYPEEWSAQQAGMSQLVPMLTTFSNLFGQYPFVNAKYGIAQCGFGGGMEHQTLTAQGTFSSEMLNSHELGHSWWGNMITCATWKDIWLNEGFASYGEALWKEFKGGQSNKTALHSYMASLRPQSISGTVYCYDDTNPSRIFSTTYSYQKGAWVLHQLRGIVGDATFFQILADYRKVKAYDAATTAEFTQIASAVYGKDLTWFVDQCVMKGGAPYYDWGWAHRTVGSRHYLFLHVEQTQAPRGYGLFQFPIEIRVDGKSYRVVNDAWRDEFVIPLAAAPASVEFDPAPWILRQTTTNIAFRPSLTASATTVPSTGGSIQLGLNAGSQLAGRGYLIGGSLSGIAPGIRLPGTPEEKTLSLVFDVFSQLVFGSMNTPMFQNFAGVLDTSGQAAAQLVLPVLGPVAVGLQAHFAWLTVDAPFTTSVPVTITVAP
ncbi:MAG: M1 family metallopeptidase [Planctomycetes bacterium]|nr:M1 family metallopeptidase [Planctomycetota bacterium]